MNQEFESCLTGWCWLRVPHEITVEMWQGWNHLKILLKPEEPFLRQFTHRAVDRRPRFLITGPLRGAT